MKLSKIIFTFFILFAAFSFCPAQHPLPQARLVDEFGKLCSEDIMSRFDSFMIQAQDDPSSQAYILFYGNKDQEGKNLKFIQYFGTYQRFRRFDPAGLNIKRGQNMAEMKIQFWIVPAGADPPKPAKEFVEFTVASTTMFDVGFMFKNKSYGYLDGMLDLGCEFSPNGQVFKDILRSNPALTGYLIVYSKIGENKIEGNKIASYAVSDLVGNYKISRKRLKTIYGGQREKSQVELWLVPANDKPPVPTPAK